jgi:flagellar assembly factor FliW
MPVLEATRFGPIPYTEAEVYVFSQGIPAFEKATGFLLVQNPAWAPLLFLQSVDNQGLSLPCLDLRSFLPDYHFELTGEDRSLLGGATEDRLLCLGIVTIPGDIPPTVNLLAPVLLDPLARRGVQSIQFESDYSWCHPLRPPQPDEAVTC